MSDQDSQDINQMMASTAEVEVERPRKSRFLWVVLSCVVVGVGLGIFVYQRSTVPAPSIKPTPRPVATVAPPVASPVTSPVVPPINVVTPVANTMTFPKKGKLRIYTDLNNIQLVIKVVTGGVPQTLTLTNKAVSTTTPMNFVDSSFVVEAGSIGTIEGYLNSTSGPKLRGWVNADDQKKCGSNGVGVIDMEAQLAFVQSKLAGESIFGYQCWEDDDLPGEFNDIYMVWTYAPGSTTIASPSPSASASPALSPSPSPSRAASPSPSASSAASPTPTPTPSASPRVAMPDTSQGTPVTGVFEVTVASVSLGLILLMLGLFGLLAL